MAATCSKCGSQIKGSHVFCPECGIRVSGMTSAPAVVPPGAGAPEEKAPEAAGSAVREPVAPPSGRQAPTQAGVPVARTAGGVPPPPTPAPRASAAQAAGMVPPPPTPAPRASAGPGGPVAPAGGPTRQRTSGWAVAALILGLAAFTCLPVVGAILAIVFAAIARGSIKQSKGSVKGLGMANGGLALGIIGLIIPVVFAAIFIPLGIHYLLPGARARDNLLHGVDAARIYYNERGSYAGMTASELTRIDDTVDFRMAPGSSPDVVYVDKIDRLTVRLYCYSTRSDRFVASALGDQWTYNFDWHWGPFINRENGDEW